MDPDPAIHMPAVHAFAKYDFTVAVLSDTSRAAVLLKNERLILGMSRAFVHYSINGFFLEAPLLKGLPKITHLPAIIVQGRHDHLTPPQTAFDV